MALYTKPDFTFNDHNRAVIRLNRECVVELDLVPDRNNTNQYGAAVTVHNELNGDVYGESLNVPVVDGKSVVWNQLAPSFTAELISTGTSSKSVSFAEGAKVIAGHKYLISALIETDTNYGVYVYTRVNGTNKDTLRAQFQNGGRLYVIATSLYSAESIGTMQAVEGNLWLYLAIPTTGEHYVNASDHRIIDLTLLFGSGNEPEDLDDDRIYWIESYAAIHPEYNEGVLVRMEE